jgi:hypothetical protein
MDDRGSAKHLWTTTGVSTHRQGHGTRQLPFVAGRWLLALLASGLGSSVGAPSTTDPLIHWYLGTWVADLTAHKMTVAEDVDKCHCRAARTGTDPRS